MKTEKILFGILIIGVILKLLHIPGGSIVVVSVLLLLTLMYLLFSFYFFRDTTTKQQNIILSIISGLCLSLTTIGVLFVLMQWNGGYNMLLPGIITAFMVLIPACILFFKSTETGLKTYYKNMFIRAGILFITSATMGLLLT